MAGVTTTKGKGGDRAIVIDSDDQGGEAPLESENAVNSHVDAASYNLNEISYG